MCFFSSFFTYWNKFFYRVKNMMQITPSVNRVRRFHLPQNVLFSLFWNWNNSKTSSYIFLFLSARKILGSNSNRFAPNHSFTTTPSSSSGMASSSGPNNVQQTHSISDGSAVGNANMMRPPNASSASGSGGGPPPSAMFAECWQQMSFGNNGQNTGICSLR